MAQNKLNCFRMESTVGLFNEGRCMFTKLCLRHRLCMCRESGLSFVDGFGTKKQ